MAPIMKDSYINISLAFHACGDCTDVDICVIDHILGLLIFSTYLTSREASWLLCSDFMSCDQVAEAQTMWTK